MMIFTTCFPKFLPPRTPLKSQYAGTNFPLADQFMSGQRRTLLCLLFPVPGARLKYGLHQNHIEHRWNDDTKEKVMLPFMEKDNEGNAYEFGQAEGSGQEID